MQYEYSIDYNPGVTIYSTYCTGTEYYEDWRKLWVCFIFFALYDFF